MQDPDLSTEHDRPTRPATSGRAWTSFVAADQVGDGVVRVLHDEANAAHRLRVEHDAHTLLVHLAGEDGHGWTTLAVDRPTRRWAVAQGRRQADTAHDAFEQLYEL